MEAVLKIIVPLMAESLSSVSGIEEAGPKNDDNSEEMNVLSSCDAQADMTKPMEEREVPVPYGKENQ